LRKKLINLGGDEAKSRRPVKEQWQQNKKWLKGVPGFHWFIDGGIKKRKGKTANAKASWEIGIGREKGVEGPTIKGLEICNTTDTGRGGGEKITT